MDVIDRFKDGNRAVDIARDLGLQSSTVRTIRRNAAKITLSAQSVTALSASRLSRNRSVIMEKMETLLTDWIEEQRQINLSVSLKSIQVKALALFDYLKHKLGDSAKDDKFTASRGWFERFKRRSNLHNTKISTDSPHIDLSILESTKLQKLLSKIIEDGCYTPQQVFSVHKTSLLWRHLPFKKHLTQNKFYQQFSKEYVNLLLGGNAAGDVKLKPLVVCQDESPSQIKNYSNPYSPVLIQSSEKSKITQKVFEEWFSEYFFPTSQDYCHRNNFIHKVLLIIENVPDYHSNLDGLSHNIQVVFLSNSSSNLEPSISQTITKTFKSLFTQQLLKQSHKFMESGTKEDFWQSYNLRCAFDNISHVWQQVKMHELIQQWQNIWPDLCEVNLNDLNQLFKETHEEGIIHSPQTEADNMEMKDVVGFVKKQEDTFFQKDLTEMKKFQEATWSNSQINNLSLTSTDLMQAFSHLSKAMEIFSKKDPCQDRSEKVNKNIKNAISFYQELHTKMTNNSC